jgi:hypothetical protein
MDRITTIGGIQIPSSNPVFLAVVAIHILLGLACVASGALAMLSLKGPGRHPTAGTYYYRFMAGVFATAAALSAMRWAEDYYLFILGSLAFVAVIVGRSARRRRWSHWARWHISSMGASYILLLTAFYVDNGRQLPLWRSLPEWTYWVLPVAAGTPLMIWALWRHPRRAG